MLQLDDVAPACGVLISIDDESGFDHLGTAWSVGPGEWVTVWSDDAPADTVRLLVAATGEHAAIEGWEADEDTPIVGFRSIAAPTHLRQTDRPLGKRDELTAVGYPSVIDHPLFQLHRPSLSPERYVPYLCPWMIAGHCCLFTAEAGFLTGRWYAGMRGGPVLDADGGVVGLLADAHADAASLPLTRFLRLA